MDAGKAYEESNLSVAPNVEWYMSHQIVGVLHVVARTAVNQIQEDHKREEWRGILGAQEEEMDVLGILYNATALGQSAEEAATHKLCACMVWSSANAAWALEDNNANRTNNTTMDNDEE